MTCVLFGLAPALYAARRSVNDALKEVSRGMGQGRQRHRLRGALVVSEVALALLLLSGAGLLVKTFLHLQQVHPGFDPRRVLDFQLNLPQTKYDNPDKRRLFYARLADRLSAIPSVATAAAVSNLPLGSSNWGWGFTVENRPPPAPGAGPGGNFRVVTPGYFTPMGIPLLQGYDFTAADRGDSSPVIIIDATMVRQYFPDEHPLGKRVKLGSTDSAVPWREIIGVAGEVKHYGLDCQIRAGFSLPHAQKPVGGMHLVVRGRTDDPLVLVPVVREEVRQLDSDLPVFAPRPITWWPGPFGRDGSSARCWGSSPRSPWRWRQWGFRA